LGTPGFEEFGNRFGEGFGLGAGDGGIERDGELETLGAGGLRERSETEIVEEGSVIECDGVDRLGGLDVDAREVLVFQNDEFALLVFGAFPDSAHTAETRAESAPNRWSSVLKILFLFAED
jgi:hypothetical protein